LILSFLFHIASTDLLTDHLTNNVDVSVNPCDDFYQHVCSQSINDTEFPLNKIERFYDEITAKFSNFSYSSNLAIMNDWNNMLRTGYETKRGFNRSEFEDRIRMRCLDSDDCYREEFAYFSGFYAKRSNESNDRLTYFLSKLNTTKGDEILAILPDMVESTYNLIYARLWNKTEVLLNGQYGGFYGHLTNRLFVMEELKKDGIFEKIVDYREDVKQFKELFIEKFKNTPWLNEKDNLGLTFLREFEDQMNDLVVYYDLDENDRDLELLRTMNSLFSQEYYRAKTRSTGAEALDTIFALETAFSTLNKTSDPEVKVLLRRVLFNLRVNAVYYDDVNKVAILAPFLYPELNDNSTLNKPYALFSIIGHEISHSVMLKKWANRSSTFKKGMECLTDHYNRTCDRFGKGVCNSGTQSFAEDGSDVLGARINYEFFTRNYKEEERNEIVFDSKLLSVNREQAFFYVFGSSWCSKITEATEHTDVHSHDQIRVNGLVAQMPEFAKAFHCSPHQAMYPDKMQCHLFGPDAK
ncbi:hypothetical protein PENTCL1PPCAC_5347, partial [Pristionchus entomophagus]